MGLAVDVITLSRRPRKKLHKSRLAWHLSIYLSIYPSICALNNARMSLSNLRGEREQPKLPPSAAPSRDLRKMPPAFASSLRPPPRSPSRSPHPTLSRTLNEGTLRLTRTANLVDEYKLHETLGSSAAFQVRRATRRASGEQCAIKLLHLSDALVTPRGDPAVELLSEIEILRALQGAPGVVSLLDHLRQAEPPVMAAVFELLVGGDLFDRIERQGPCTEPEAAQIAQQVGGALAHMHSLRIVHRDIKPDNLAFASRGDAIEVKLIDFGFATICPQDKLRGLSGTMDYAAPELVSWYAESQEEGAQSPLGVGAVEGTPYDEVSQSSPPPTLPPSPSAMPPSRPHLSPLTPQPHLLHTLCTHLPPAPPSPLPPHRPTRRSTCGVSASRCTLRSAPSRPFMPRRAMTWSASSCEVHSRSPSRWIGPTPAGRESRQTRSSSSPHCSPWHPWTGSARLGYSVANGCDAA